MRRVIIALLVIAGITLVLVALSIKAFPQWLTIPGGLLILLGVAFKVVLDAGSKIKDWVDLLFTKGRKAPSPGPQPSHSEIRQQGGSNVVAERIDHLEVHSSSADKSQNITPPAPKEAKLKISGSTKTKDRLPHIEVVVVNNESKIVYCRAKCFAIYDSTGKNIKRDISDYANHFSWSGGSDRGTKEIPAELDGIINLVRTNYGGGIAFLFDENPNSYWWDGGVYKIELEIAGTIEDGAPRTEFVGIRVIVEFQYTKNEIPDVYGGVINNSELELIATRFVDEFNGT